MSTFFLFLLLLPSWLLAATTWHLDQETYLRTDPEVSGQVNLTTPHPNHPLTLTLTWYYPGHTPPLPYQETYTTGQTNSAGNFTTDFSLPSKTPFPPTS